VEKSITDGGSAVTGDNGRLLDLSAPKIDVTKQKGEETLIHAREKLQQMFESVPDAITATDLNGVIVDCNPKTVKMHGFGSKDEVLGKDAFELIAYRDRERAGVNMQKTLKKGLIEGIEYTLLKADGSEFPAELTASVLRDHSGRTVGFIAITRDITARKQNQQSLQQSEQRFKSIYDESPIGIELYDSAGLLLTANKACLDIFGVSDVRDVVGFQLLEDPNLPDEQKGRLRKGEEVRYEMAFDFEKVRKYRLYETRKSGVIYLDVLITPMGSKKKVAPDGFLVQVQDISERKRAEEALQESEKKYQELADSLPQIVFEIDE